MKYQKTVYQALMMITQFGVNMLVPIFLCSFVGMFLDRKLGTSVWMVALFFRGRAGRFYQCIPICEKDLRDAGKDAQTQYADKRREGRE